MSLAYHPDKLRQRGEVLTEEQQQKFRDIKQAYEVLVDPERRKLYDALGINGLTLHEDPSSFMKDPQKMQEMIARADKRAYCVVLSIVTLVLSYLFLFPVLFGLEVDGSIQLSFALVFTPLWIVYALVLVALLTAVARGTNTRPEELEPDAEWEDEDPLSGRLAALGVFGLFVGCQACIVAKLDGGIDSSAPWAVVLVPYYIFEVCQVAGELVARKSALAEAASEEAAAAKAKADAEKDEEGGGSMAGLGFDERMQAEQHREHAEMAASAAVYYAFRLMQVGRARGRKTGNSLA